MSWLDRARSQGHAGIAKLPGKLGELARKANEALGRPLADADELADRKAFEARAAAGGTAKPAAKPAAKTGTDVAPVIVYHMDKTRRDALRLVEILDGAGIPHQVTNIQEDPAAQMAVRRDSKGYRLPVVFIAGEPIGGRAELSNLASSGELKKRVFGA
ncbi:MAG: glutaredoxin family protein [Kofleriaceae bacterium]